MTPIIYDILGQLIIRPENTYESNYVVPVFVLFVCFFLFFLFVFFMSIFAQPILSGQASSPTDCLTAGPGPEVKLFFN